MSQPTDAATQPAQGRAPKAPLPRLGPHSIEAEEAVLGAVLIYPEVLLELTSIVQPDDFYELKHRWIWEAMLALSERGDAIDLLTVTEELRQRHKLEDIGGAAYVAQLANNTPTYLYAETYAQVVRRAAIRRRLMEAAGKIADFARDESRDLQEAISAAEVALFSVTDESLRREIIPLEQAVNSFYRRVEELYLNQQEILGLPTRFSDLDKLLGGLQKSDLIIVAARPGVGKTSFLLSVVLNAARSANARTAFFSLEMGHEQLTQRLYSIETGINSQRLRDGKLDDHEWERFVEATSRLNRLPIFIDDTPGISVQQVRARCRRLKKEGGLDLIVVDYLQLLSSGSTRADTNRVQEISFISRSLKEMARELKVPVLAAAQLSRAVEQRADKRPQLSDLRESGCLAGDTLISLADGRYVTIRSLAGDTDIGVQSLDESNLQLVEGRAIKAFYTGIKPVYRLTTALGRTIRATANHRFLTFDGWRRLDELTAQDYLALPRLNKPAKLTGTMRLCEAGLLAHLIGDGCTLSSHAIQYTSCEPELAQLVASLAHQCFEGQVTTRIVKERNWFQVYFPSVTHLTHGVHHPLASWLRKLGIFDKRSHEKFVPQAVFRQPNSLVAHFLRHIWATDGSISLYGSHAKCYYASSSYQLAVGVQSLLLRLGINARLKVVAQKEKRRDQFHVIITGIPDLRIFVDQISAVGDCKTLQLRRIAEHVARHCANTNRDIIPRAVWQQCILPVMKTNRITSRHLQAALGNAYCGTALYRQNISRERALRISEVVPSQALVNLARSDIYWDRIISIVPDGESDVYDLTVPHYHNFVANNIIVHNSIEQDSDVVIFLYRDELYNPNTEHPNQAEVIVAKHRNGPTGKLSLYFRKDLTQFVDIEVRHGNVADL